MKKVSIARVPALDFGAKEALNTICTNIMFSGKRIKKVLLTSCVAGEGKSTMAARIVFNMAQRGKSAVLVDSDLRRSMMVKRFGITGEGEIKGLAHYLSGQCEMTDICYQTNFENVYVVPAGRDVSNPIALINSREYGEFINQLSEEFDLVVVDTPPVGVVIDAVEISSFVDGVIMVIEYGKRRRRELQDVVKQMRRSGTPILGCVIDKVKVRTLSEKKYYKSHYYYSHYGKEGYYAAEPKGHVSDDEGGKSEE